MYFEKWVPVDLLRLPTHVQDIGMSVYTGDNLSVRIGAKVTKNGVDEDVTGTVSGYVILPNGTTIATITGASSGNLAWIDLPEDAFVLPGRIQIAIRVTDGTTKTVLLAATATVRPVATTTAYDPDGEIPTWDEIEAKIEAIDDAVEQASSMVSYAAQTGKTDAEKAQARGNIGAASENLEGVTLISGTYSGTKSTSITQAFTAGTYRITAQSITSADTDADTCMVMFMDSSTEVLGLQMARGTNVEAYAVVPAGGTRVAIYASKNWAAGDGDTFSFSGLKIEKVAPLVSDMFGMESAVKPALFGSWQGTLSKSIVMDFPEGDYFIQIDKITSSDTAYEQSAISFTDSSNDIIITLLFQRNRPQYRSFHIPANAAKVFLYASTNYPNSSGKEFNYINLKIWKVNRRLLDDSMIPTPVGFSWTSHPLDGYLRRTENGIVCDMDIRALFRPKTGMTYWVATDGDDSNPGYSSSAPLRTIGAALGKSNAVSIRIKDGFYDADTIPGHVSSFSRSVAVVANDGAHPVIASSNGASTWTQTSGKTYTYQTAADSNAVWDIGNSMAYTRVDSAAEVESTAASYYCDGTNTYVHTKDGTAPTSDIRCCLARDNFRITTSGKPALYFEGLTIVGGDSGAFRVTCDGTNRPKVYAKDCTFIGAAAWGACYLEGCEAILQNCEATGSKADGFGIHRNNTTNTVSPRHIEINCHGHHNGVTGNTTSNGSTVHAAGYAIRVNGDYHHNVGPNVADVHNGTQIWNLGCHAWASLIGTDTTGNSDFLISDATTGENAMWLDNCSGYGSKYSMCANEHGTAYVRGGAFEAIHVSTGGHMESY